MYLNVDMQYVTDWVSFKWALCLLNTRIERAKVKPEFPVLLRCATRVPPRVSQGFIQRSRFSSLCRWRQWENTVRDTEARKEWKKLRRQVEKHPRREGMWVEQMRQLGKWEKTTCNLQTERQADNRRKDRQSQTLCLTLTLSLSDCVSLWLFVSPSFTVSQCPICLSVSQFLSDSQCLSVSLCLLDSLCLSVSLSLCSSKMVS